MHGPDIKNQMEEEEEEEFSTRKTNQDFLQWHNNLDQLWNLPSFFFNSISSLSVVAKQQTSKSKLSPSKQKSYNKTTKLTPLFNTYRNKRWRLEDLYLALAGSGENVSKLGHVLFKSDAKKKKRSQLQTCNAKTVVTLTFTSSMFKEGAAETAVMWLALREKSRPVNAWEKMARRRAAHSAQPADFKLVSP